MEGEQIQQVPVNLNQLAVEAGRIESEADFRRCQATMQSCSDMLALLGSDSKLVCKPKPLCAFMDAASGSNIKSSIDLSSGLLTVPNTQDPNSPSSDQQRRLATCEKQFKQDRFMFSINGVGLSDGIVSAIARMQKNTDEPFLVLFQLVLHEGKRDVMGTCALLYFCGFTVHALVLWSKRGSYKFNIPEPPKGKDGAEFMDPIYNFQEVMKSAWDASQRSPDTRDTISKMKKQLNLLLCQKQPPALGFVQGLSLDPHLRDHDVLEINREADFQKWVERPAGGLWLPSVEPLGAADKSKDIYILATSGTFLDNSDKQYIRDDMLKQWGEGNLGGVEWHEPNEKLTWQDGLPADVKPQLIKITRQLVIVTHGQVICVNLHSLLLEATAKITFQQQGFIENNLDLIKDLLVPIRSLFISAHKIYHDTDEAEVVVLLNTLFELHKSTKNREHIKHPAKMLAKFKQIPHTWQQKAKILSKLYMLENELWRKLKVTSPRQGGNPAMLVYGAVTSAMVRATQALEYVIIRYDASGRIGWRDDILLVDVEKVRAGRAERVQQGKEMMTALMADLGEGKAFYQSQLQKAANNLIQFTSKEAADGGESPFKIELYADGARLTCADKITTMRQSMIDEVNSNYRRRNIDKALRDIDDPANRRLALDVIKASYRGYCDEEEFFSDLKEISTEVKADVAAYIKQAKIQNDDEEAKGADDEAVDGDQARGRKKAVKGQQVSKQGAGKVLQKVPQKKPSKKGKDGDSGSDSDKQNIKKDQKKTSDQQKSKKKKNPKEEEKKEEHTESITVTESTEGFTATIPKREVKAQQKIQQNPVAQPSSILQAIGGIVNPPQPLPNDIFGDVTQGAKQKYPRGTRAEKYELGLHLVRQYEAGILKQYQQLTDKSTRSGTAPTSQLGLMGTKQTHVAKPQNPVQPILDQLFNQEVVANNSAISTEVTHQVLANQMPENAEARLQEVASSCKTLYSLMAKQLAIGRFNYTLVKDKAGRMALSESLFAKIKSALGVSGAYELEEWASNFVLALQTDELKRQMTDRPRELATLHRGRFGEQGAIYLDMNGLIQNMHGVSDGCKLAWQFMEDLHMGQRANCTLKKDLKDFGQEVERNFHPFYQLEEESPTYFDKITAIVKDKTKPKKKNLQYWVLQVDGKEALIPPEAFAKSGDGYATLHAYICAQHRPGRYGTALGIIGRKNFMPTVSADLCLKNITAIETLDLLKPPLSLNKWGASSLAQDAATLRKYPYAKLPSLKPRELQQLMLDENDKLGSNVSKCQSDRVPDEDPINLEQATKAQKEREQAGEDFLAECGKFREYISDLNSEQAADQILEQFKISAENENEHMADEFYKILEKVVEKEQAMLSMMPENKEEENMLRIIAPPADLKKLNKHLDEAMKTAPTKYRRSSRTATKPPSQLIPQNFFEARLDQSDRAGYNPEKDCLVAALNESIGYKLFRNSEIYMQIAKLFYHKADFNDRYGDFLGNPLFSRYPMFMEKVDGQFIWYKLQLLDVIGPGAMKAFRNDPKMIDAFITLRNPGSNNLVTIVQAYDSQIGHVSHGFNFQKDDEEAWSRMDLCDNDEWRSLSNVEATNGYFWYMNCTMLTFQWNIAAITDSIHQTVDRVSPLLYMKTLRSGNERALLRELGKAIIEEDAVFSIGGKCEKGKKNEGVKGLPAITTSSCIIAPRATPEAHQHVKEQKKHLRQTITSKGGQATKGTSRATFGVERGNVIPTVAGVRSSRSQSKSSGSLTSTLNRQQRGSSLQNSNAVMEEAKGSDKSNASMKSV